MSEANIVPVTLQIQVIKNIFILNGDILLYVG